MDVTYEQALDAIKMQVASSTRDWAKRWEGRDESTFCRRNGVPSFVVARSLGVEARKMLQQFRKMEKYGLVVIVREHNWTRVWPVGFLKELREE
tara:strand:+ start:9845 stop:10126 length:282 start_codon:yes stop_codon:yes gene_type:complete